MDMLLGLDMLRRFQASIDLGKNALIIQGRSLRFLDEHELPPHARLVHQHPDEGSSSGAEPTTQASANTQGPSTSARPVSSSSWSEASITALTNLGMSREKAIDLLNKTSGNENIAASIYFQ